MAAMTRRADQVCLTPVGAALSDGLSFEEWLSVGRRLLPSSNASAWWIGDWLAYGEWRYGHKYRIAVERLQLDYDRIRDYVYVASRVGKGVRRADLSWRHHRLVAKLDPAEQLDWLARAAEQKWSTRELAEALGRSRESAARAAALAQLRLSVDPTQLDVWQGAARTLGLDFGDWAVKALNEAASRTTRARRRYSRAPAVAS
jgi:hypothetical protein